MIVRLSRKLFLYHFLVSEITERCGKSRPFEADFSQVDSIDQYKVPKRLCTHFAVIQEIIYATRE